MNPKHLAPILLVATLSLASPAALAGLQLNLVSGAQTVTITDGGAGDANPAAGAVTFVGSVGTYNINVTTGLDSGVLVFPEIMDLSSVDVTGSGGNLLIGLTQTGLNFGSGPLQVNGFIGGTNSGTSIAYALYADAADTAFGMGSLLFSGSSSAAAFADSGGSSFTDPSGTFSLYQRVEISGGPGSTSFDFSARIPEPGTAALAGAALLALGAVARRRPQRSERH